MTAYYNEIDPYAAQWLRNLIAAGHIAAGDVDERSIEDVRPDDLRGYTQCHFFAGIGVWSYALRRAGVPDSQPVWTGSCPCQPFSAAGQGAGFADERHLWPAFFHLIEQCGPAIVFGEQVASKDADPWIDLVQDDLEALGYAVGAVPFPSAGVGAPHIRDRLYWVADASGERWDGRQDTSGEGGRLSTEASSIASWLGYANGTRLEGLGNGHQAEIGHREGALRPVAAAGELGGMADTDENGCQSRLGIRPICAKHDAQHGSAESIERPGPTNGFWRDADWLGCRDGKWRPVEPGTFPLAHGAPARMGRLRAYGNAINAIQAAEFIQAVTA